MVKRIGTSRRKTRHLFKKTYQKKGKISMTDYFQSFDDGEKVYLTVEPSVHKGMYFRRFVGKAGIIRKKNGKCYEVMVKDFKKEKKTVKIYKLRKLKKKKSLRIRNYC